MPHLAHLRWRHTEYYAQRLAALNEIFQEDNQATIQQTLNELQQNYAQIVHGQSWAATHYADDSRAADLTIEYAVQPAALQTYQHRRVRVEWLEQALAAARVLNDREYEMLILHNLGFLFKQLGQLTQARQYYEQEYALWTPADESVAPRNTVLHALGNIYSNLGSKIEAMEYFAQALNACVEAQDYRNACGVLSSMVHLLSSEGEFDLAFETTDKMVAIGQKFGDPSLIAQGFESKALIFRTQNNRKQAFQFDQQALILYHSLGDLRRMSHVFYSLGNIFYRVHETKAQRYFEHALVISRQIADGDTTTKMLRRLGDLYTRQQKYSQALEQYYKVLPDQTEHGHEVEAADTLRDIGKVYSKQNEHSKAIDYYLQALNILVETEEKSSERYVLSDLGNSYTELEDFQRAIHYFEQARAMAHEIEDHQAEEYALQNSATAYTSLGQHEKALELRQKALEITRKIGDQKRERNALSKLGDTYFALEQYQTAIEYYAPALALAHELGDPTDETIALLDLTLAHSRLEQYDKAIDYRLQNLSINRTIGDRDSELYDLLALGEISAAAENDQQAIQYLRDVLDIARELEVTDAIERALQSLASSYSNLEDYIHAIDCYQQVLSIHRETNDRNGELYALSYLGDVYLDSGQHHDALQCYEQVLVITRELDDFHAEEFTLKDLIRVHTILENSRQVTMYTQQAEQLQQRLNMSTGNAD